MNEESNQKSNQRLGRALRAAGLFVLEIVKIGVLAGITIAFVRYYLFKPFYVKGASMEPNFYDHEYLIIDELTFRLRPIERGEVVVFRYPGNPKEYFLKRIIGLPGERVKVSDAHVTVYNDAHPEGIQIKESYLPADLQTIGEKITVLASNQYFVMGDNRPNSFDSRRFGPIDRSAIVGRAWLRGWPINRLQTFTPPSFNL
ncbi:MAG: signal peptidase I [Candidatus Magasanikbacteria bacterium]|nr:signal peptidase I [Candidatus Magasanikbacteria bacterium]